MKLLAALLISLGLSTMAMANEVGNAFLSQSVGFLTSSGDRSCTLAKIGPKKFLTARHCVRFAMPRNFTVVFEDATMTWPESREAVAITNGLKSKSNERAEDWAIIHTETDIKDMQSLKLNCVSAVKLGQEVMTMGYPAPMGRYFTRGYINSVESLEGGIVNSDFFMDLRAAPGSSGAPIVDERTGEIIGVLIEGIVPFNTGNIATGAQAVYGSTLCSMFDSESHEIDDF